MSLAIDLYMKMLEQRRNQGRLVILLSALIMILKFSDVTLEKIAVAGSEVTIKQPFVITGAIAVMLLYNAIRHVTYVFGVQALGRTIPDLKRVAKDMQANTGFTRFCSFTYFAIDTVMAMMTAILAVVALWVARHDIEMLAALVVRGLG